MNALGGCCISRWSARQLFSNNMTNTEGEGRGEENGEGEREGEMGRKGVDTETRGEMEGVTERE